MASKDDNKGFLRFALRIVAIMMVAIFCGVEGAVTVGSVI